ncbi:hypothetical protein [Micromonospora halophytica]|uniref:NPCBM/NEW2 domain-containing protein n=1 Tax=Micromonospora halophytica TaxID=47864 RepID=A0A1C5HCC5_9ACTN|nr:hypothetical protein [Micromonospora halophytica]SCG43666.1 hypothetical protein GA0070560_103475 [Micromonospora halophytica]
MTDDQVRRIGPGPTGGTTPRIARHRHRRRWVIESLGALTCLLALVAYLNFETEPELPATGGDLSAGAPTVAGRPTGLPGVVTEAGVASPGLQPRQRPPSPSPSTTPTPAPKPEPVTAVLTVAEVEVPAVVDLTGLGTRDWVHWGLAGPDRTVRKRDGSGEIRDEGGRGQRATYDTNPEGFSWRDGTPVGSADATATGTYACGVGNGFALSVAGSGELRTVHLFAGLWMSRGRLDVRLSTGGPTRTLRLEDPHTNHTAQWVVRFRVPRGQKLLVSWTTERTFNGCGNVGIQAVALR